MEIGAGPINVPRYRARSVIWLVRRMRNDAMRLMWVGITIRSMHLSYPVRLEIITIENKVLSLDIQRCDKS